VEELTAYAPCMTSVQGQKVKRSKVTRSRNVSAATTP